MLLVHLSWAGTFRKEALTLAMKAIGTNTAKFSEPAAASRSQKSNSGSSVNGFQRFCKYCKQSNVNHSPYNCKFFSRGSPERGRDRDRDRSPSRRDRDNKSDKDGDKSAKDGGNSD